MSECVVRMKMPQSCEEYYAEPGLTISIQREPPKEDA